MEDAPDTDCYTLPDGDCITPNCKLHGGRSFAPQVMIDGEAYTPTGWMWILSFALAGVPWALQTVTDPDYNLREKIDDYMRRKKEFWINFEVESIERRLVELKAELKML